MYFNVNSFIYTLKPCKLLFFPHCLPPCVSPPPSLSVSNFFHCSAKTVIMFAVSFLFFFLLPQAPLHKHISEQISKMGVSACMLLMPNHNCFPGYSCSSSKERGEMLGKKIARKVPSVSLREDHLDMQFPTQWQNNDNQTSGLKTNLIMRVIKIIFNKQTV